MRLTQADVGKMVVIGTDPNGGEQYPKQNAEVVQVHLLDTYDCDPGDADWAEVRLAPAFRTPDAEWTGSLGRATDDGIRNIGFSNILRYMDQKQWQDIADNTVVELKEDLYCLGSKKDISPYEYYTMDELRKLFDEPIHRRGDKFVLNLQDQSLDSDKGTIGIDRLNIVNSTVYNITEELLRPPTP